MFRKLVAIALLAPQLASAEEVTVGNFVRAETDHMIGVTMKAAGSSIGELSHSRDPVTPENQTVIRSNQDTLYTTLVLDLSEPATVTMPDIGGRYMSMHVVNQDHYMFVEATPGSYVLTEEEVGSRFAYVLFRTFADPSDAEDLTAAHAAQDGIAVSGGGAGPFEAPDWDTDNLAVIRGALNDVAVLGFDFSNAFGRKDEVYPIDHLLGAAAGWAGLPRSAAIYLIEVIEDNDGKVPHVLNASDVPVDGFWSVTVYNADGYLEPNDTGRNSYNNVTAEANDDGSITVHFGNCEDGRINCLPITPGWNYAVRLYEPRSEILDGSWTFPSLERAN